MLIAGAIAFMVAVFGGSDEKTPLPPAPTQAAPQAAPADKVERAARVAAGKFILTAVARKNLAESWAVTHPELKRGYTLAEWKRGDIPVIPFPVGAIDEARFKVDQVQKNEVLLQVALIPKPGAEEQATVFFIGLKAAGTGPERRWLVNYWMPNFNVPVPDDPS